jgi:hypothetical protein
LEGKTSNAYRSLRYSLLVFSKQQPFSDLKLSLGQTARLAPAISNPYAMVAA